MMMLLCCSPRLLEVEEAVQRRKKMLWPRDQGSPGWWRHRSLQPRERAARVLVIENEGEALGTAVAKVSI